MWRRLILCTACATASILAADPGSAAAPAAERLEHWEHFRRYQQFESVAAFADGEDEATAKRLSKECGSIDRRCLMYLRNHPEHARKALPDRGQYWEAFNGVLRSEPVPPELYPLDHAMPGLSRVVEASIAWARHRVLDGKIDLWTLRGYLAAHRRRLAVSNLLIDKMIFAATVGITLPLLNLSMAERGTDASGAAELDDLLEPLSPDERSLRRVLAGELAFSRRSLRKLAKDDPPMLHGSLVQLEGELAEAYELIGSRSAADWEDFWRNGLGIGSGDYSVLLQVALPAMDSYAVNLRYLDAQLYVLRALRDVYEGRVSPGPPARPAPFAWRWHWDFDAMRLCLEPAHVDPAFEHVSEVCADYHVRD
jgi:hypothetical protein